MERLLEILEILTSLPSVSGSEYMAEKKLREYIAPMFEGFAFTSLGSFIGYTGPADGAPLILDAHLDEIGFYVTELLSGGFLRFTTAGGLDPKVLSAADVTIYGKETIHGVITSVPPHLAPASKEKIELSELLIDTGLDDKTLRSLVDIGTPVGHRGSLTPLTHGIYAGRGLDDKLCAACILRGIELAGDKIKNRVIFSFSACEETAYKGVTTTGNLVDKNADCSAYGVVFDVTHAHVPGVPIWREGVKSGKGPVVSYSAQTSRTWTTIICSIAKKSGIPLQLFAEPNRTGTNSGALRLSGRSGIQTSLVSVPLKNMHTASETFDISDAMETSRLVCALVSEKLEKIQRVTEIQL